MNAPTLPNSLGLMLATLGDAPPSHFLAEAAKALSIDEVTAGVRIASGSGLQWLEHLPLDSVNVRTDLVSLSECRRRSCCIVELDGALFALMSRPPGAVVRTFLQSAALPNSLALALVPFATLEEVLSKVGGAPAEGIAPLVLDAQEEGEGGEELLVTVGDEASQSAVSLINECLAAALSLEASDIHLESTGSGLLIRLRVDGLLEDLRRTPGRALAEQVLSRLKVLGSLDISERRRPQDGRFRIRFEDHAIDVRLSVMPSVHGEDAVLRLLDKSSLVAAGEQLTLDALGFGDRGLQRLRDLSALPYGMLLVTGPTGSGKTTTLYAILNEINRGRDKIVTIEDPVEYQLPGILQVPVNEKKGLTFAVGLRSILRHDPDRIMVGEIRDTETADIAVQAALTGHLVLTTVHANNVFDVIGRFAHMGIDPYTFVSALNGIWAQRLLRRVCHACCEPSEEARSPEEGRRGGQFMSARGCTACRGTGYKGRLAVAECLVMDHEIRQRIIDREPLGRLRDEARLRGTVLLRDAALEAARRGLTTVEEVCRVTRDDA